MSQTGAGSIQARLRSGAGWVLGGRALTAATGVLTAGLIARLISPGELGAYFLAVSISAMVSLLAQIGLQQSVVRLVAESLAINAPARAKQAVLLTISCGAGGAAIFGLLLCFFGDYLMRFIFPSAEIGGLMGLVALWMAVQALQSLLAEAFRGFQAIASATFFGGVLTSLLSLGIFSVFGAIEAHSNLTDVLLISICAWTANVALAGAALLKMVSRTAVGSVCSIGGLRLGSTLYSALPLWVTTVALFVVTQTDLWVMGIFRPQQEVALYGAAMRLVALVSVPLMIINAVAPPMIAELYTQGKIQELERLLRRAAAWSGAPAFAALSVLFVFGSNILSLVYGAAYRDGGKLVALLSLGQLVNVWAGSSGITLMMTGHQITMMKITVLNGLFTFGLAAILATLYGGMGVAFAASMGTIIQKIVMLVVVKTKTGMWTHAKIF